MPFKAFTRPDGSRFNVANADERGDRCFIGKKGFYFYDYTPDWAINERTVNGPFKTFAEAKRIGSEGKYAGKTVQPPIVPGRRYIITQPQLNRIRELCMIGTQAHGDEFYEQIMETLDGMETL